MPSPDPRPPVVVIVGPTAVGKSEIALHLAQEMGGEIVSTDSRTFYLGMDIGTAKPSRAEQTQVPHHLIDIAAPDQTVGLAVFQELARAAIAQIHQRGRLPILVGGTGQYVRAVTEEWQLPPQPPDDRLRTVLEHWGQAIGPEALYTRLVYLDPATAEFVKPRNLRRIVRALEVIFLTGRRFSEQRLQLPSPYRVLQIGLRRPRPELYARVDARIEAMLQAGWVQEVQDLLAAGYSARLPAMSAIGYEQLAAYLHGRLTYSEAVALTKRLTRQFIRRQGNWFKESDPHIHWFHPDEPDGLARMTGLVTAWLAGARLPGE